MKAEVPMISPGAVGRLINDGDMVAFVGAGGVSELIRFGQNMLGHGGRWISDLRYGDVTHTALIARSGAFGLPMPGPFLLEATSLNQERDALTGRLIRGVQVVPLASKVARYKGRCFVLPTRFLGDAWPGTVGMSVLDYFAETHGTAYERDTLELVASALPFQRTMQGEDATTLFCSEWCTEAWERAGLVDERDQDANANSPAEATLMATRRVQAAMNQADVQAAVKDRGIVSGAPVWFEVA